MSGEEQSRMDVHVELPRTGLKEQQSRALLKGHEFSGTWESLLLYLLPSTPVPRRLVYIKLTPQLDKMLNM